MLFEGIWDTLRSVFAAFSKNWYSPRLAFGLEKRTYACYPPRHESLMGAGWPQVIQTNCFGGEWSGLGAGKTWV